MPRSRVAFAAALCLAVASSKGVLSQLIPLGGELQINAYTSSFQTGAAVGMDADGDFVVVWPSNSQDGSYYGVFARRFNSAGVGLGAEFQVNVYTSNSQGDPAVGVAPNGDFVVAWQSDGQDGSFVSIFARRFNSAGVGIGTEFEVNTYTGDYQRVPAVAMDSDGEFVVAWHSYLQDASFYGVFARTFDSSGVALAVEIQVNAYTSNTQSRPAVGMDDDGNFMVAWQSYQQDGENWGVFAQRFNIKGDAIGAEFQVNTETSSRQDAPAVGMDGDGNFVVVWNSLDQDGDSYGIFARRFNAEGEGLATELQVNSYTGNRQLFPAASMDPDGGFVVAWESLSQDGSNYGVFARLFNAVGEAQGDELQVNVFTTSSQRGAAVSLDDDGDFVVAWRSMDQDGSDYGVFARRFGTLAVLDIDGNGAVTPLTDGLLVLRFEFGFTGTTLVAGAVDTVSCTRCDATVIEGYIQTLL